MPGNLLLTGGRLTGVLDFATAVIVPLSAQASTIRERIASAWDDVRRRVQPSSVRRSSSDNTNGTSFELGIGPRN